MNGLELYDTLHAMKGFAEIPALFMSANAPVSELEKRRVGFISKPFELEDMLNSIELLLSNVSVVITPLSRQWIIQHSERVEQSMCMGS
jgi:CheY-like chemotaxis protein